MYPNKIKVDAPKKMKTAIKKLWIEALRSDKYKQCTGKLCTINAGIPTGYCCLGVLSDIYRKKVLKKGGTIYNNKLKPDHKETLHAKVAKWAGLTLVPNASMAHSNPVVEGDFLSEHNDHGKTFIEIAKMIEKEL